MGSNEVLVTTKSSFGKKVAANVIPLVLGPEPKENGNINIQVKQKITKVGIIPDATADLLDKIDLLGWQDWSLEQQHQDKDSLLKYVCTFMMDDMDLANITG